MSVTGARVAAIFALFGLTMAAGLGPVLVFNLWSRKRSSSTNNQQADSRKSTSARILQLLLVFGGGVLLATCFVHMIPEIQENYSHYMETHASTTTDNHDDQLTTIPSVLAEKVDSRETVYKHPIHHDDEDGHSHDSVPWVEICICAGLFLTYFIEESVLLLIGRDSTHHHQHHKHSVDHFDHRHNTVEPVDNLSVKIGCDNIGIDLRSDNLTIDHHHNHNHISHHHHHQHHQHLQSNGHSDHHHLPMGRKEEGLWTRFLRGLIIVVAFLAHSIFDGIAIGLQSTTTSVWTMFFAICLHKLVVVFAIGFELYEKTRSLILTSIHMTIFAAMSPLGIFLSIVIEQGLSEDGNLTLILLNAVATGGILYIVFLEILQADRCPEINGLIQLVSLISGFILMTLMTILVGHGHD